MIRSQQTLQNVAILPEGAIFPLLTEDFAEMEGKLEENFVADVGGNILEEAIKQMVGFVMSNNLAMKFYVFGQGGKRRFGSTQLFDTVYSKCNLI